MMESDRYIGMATGGKGREDSVNLAGLVGSQWGDSWGANSFTHAFKYWCGCIYPAGTTARVTWYSQHGDQWKLVLFRIVPCVPHYITTVCQVVSVNCALQPKLLRWSPPSFVSWQDVNTLGFNVEKEAWALSKESLKIRLFSSKPSICRWRNRQIYHIILNTMGHLFTHKSF